ncbi:MAG: 50S ribosomal protein L11 methyltransferase [Opitutales bacterium]
MSAQTEIRAAVSAELADQLENYFLENEITFWGVMQRERGDPYEVFGFFPDESAADAELAKLRQTFAELPEDFVIQTIRDTDWQNAYKEFVKPWSDRQLHWIPLWEREHIAAPEGAAVVYLDAGMAFGTGAHETTRLCARRLLDYLEEDPLCAIERDVIDAGCGSGVLAFSATALGFKRVVGFDYDPEAVRVCRENIEANSHLPAPTFEVGDLETGLRGRQADLLLANIQTDVLLPHSSAIVTAVKPGGTLALSGILAKELEQVRTHYLQNFKAHHPGVEIEHNSRIDGEWADLHLRLGR